MKKYQNQYQNLESVIKDSDLSSLSKDFAEVAVDGILDDGILKDLPLVGGIVGLINFGNSINKFLTAKKIYKFLFELHDIPKNKRVKKINEINNSKIYQSTVGEVVFELLDRIESDGKPEIIGKLFAAVIEEKVDYKTFLKCAHIVKSIFYYDLEELKSKYDGKSVSEGINNAIFISGLVDTNFVGLFDEEMESMPKKSHTTLTELGDIVIKIGMK